MSTFNNYHRRYYATEKGKLARQNELKTAQARRKMWLEDFKREVGCQICGEREPCALQLHHVDPLEKDREVSQCRTWKGLFAEIRKCLMLCANCHCKTHAGLIEGVELLPRLEPGAIPQTINPKHVRNSTTPEEGTA